MCELKIDFDLSLPQQALQATALAFYDKGSMIQYDSVAFTPVRSQDGGRYRQHHEKAPEFATPDTTLYCVCSGFVYEVYRQALGLRLAPTVFGALTRPLTMIEDETLVYRWKADTGIPAPQILDEYRAHLQVGDILLFRNGKDTAGHVMLYMGGGRILHSGGEKYDMKTGVDLRESSGAILNTPWDALLVPGECYDAAENCSFLSVLRPLARKDAAQCHVTQTAMSRIRYPRLRIDRTCSLPPCQSTVPGQTLEYRIRLSNLSGAAYEPLEIRETVPAGTQLLPDEPSPYRVHPDGTLHWNVTLAAGESVCLSYRVQVTAKPGEEIVCGGGFVDEIPSNTLTHRVGQALQLLQFPALPAPSAMIGTLFRPVNLCGESLLVRSEQPGQLGPMLVPTCLGGTHFHTDDRDGFVRELRPTQFMPGDLLLRINDLACPDSSTDAAVYLSDGHFAFFPAVGRRYASDAQFLESMFTAHLFFVLRASLAQPEGPDEKEET